MSPLSEKNNEPCTHLHLTVFFVFNFRVKSLKQHLQDQSEVKFSFGLDTSSVAKCETQLSASEPSDNGRLRVSEHIKARPSATDSCAGAMEHDTGVEKITYAASCSVPPASVMWPEENSAELPQINEDVLKALTVALRQHRLTRGSRTQSQEDVVSLCFKSQVKV